MNVFILEDQDVRIAHFKEVFKTDNVVIARTAWEGVSLLADYRASTEWDYVLLDNDLGYEGPQLHSYDGTGEEVARYIVQTRPKIQAIIIHTWNSDAGKRMQKALQSAGYFAVWIPYSVERVFG